MDVSFIQRPYDNKSLNNKQKKNKQKSFGGAFRRIYNNSFKTLRLNTMQVICIWISISAIIIL